MICSIITIATRFPEFKDVCDSIDETNTLIQNWAEYSEHSGNFAAAFDLLWKKFEENEDLAKDLDFLLASAITSFMERFNSPEENDGKLTIETIEQQEDEIYGIVRIALYCSALWFAD